MKFLFVTLFPELIEQVCSYSIVGRGMSAGLLSVSCINPRDFTHDKHRTVDDSPFGGGAGMVLKPEPFVAAIRKAKEELPDARVIALCPGGRTLKQSIVEDYAHAGQNLIFVCGHYEGFDERIFNWVDEKLSVGDYVVTGGELPALMVLDAVARFIPGVLGKMASAEEDSFSTGLLEYPQYTRPVEFEGLVVPEVLRGGNHALIARWRRKQSLKATYLHRPDLLPEKFDKADAKLMAEIKAELAGEATAVTNFDIHDIARTARTYDVKKYFLIHPLKVQEEIIKKITGYWQHGFGRVYNPDRSEALDRVQYLPDIASAVAEIKKLTGKEPVTITTDARIYPNTITYKAARQMLHEGDRPVLVLFGTGFGMEKETMAAFDYILEPVYGPSNYNHLCVRSAVAIILDRLAGEAWWEK